MWGWLPKLNVGLVTQAKCEAGYPCTMWDWLPIQFLTPNGPISAPHGPIPDPHGPIPDPYGPIPDPYAPIPDPYGPISDPYGPIPEPSKISSSHITSKFPVLKCLNNHDKPSV